MDNTLTVNCLYYVACYPLHFSDFAVTKVVITPLVVTPPRLIDLVPYQFTIHDIITNYGFYVSLAWFALFYVFWGVLWCTGQRA
jgi:hypothetical protein